MLRRNRAPSPRIVAILVISRRRFTYVEDRVVQTSYTSRGRTAVNVGALNQFSSYEDKTLSSRVVPRLPVSLRDACASSITKSSPTFLWLSLNSLSTQHLFCETADSLNRLDKFGSMAHLNVNRNIIEWCVERIHDNNNIGCISQFSRYIFMQLLIENTRNLIIIMIAKFSKKKIEEYSAKTLQKFFRKFHKERIALDPRLNLQNGTFIKNHVRDRRKVREISEN